MEKRNPQYVVDENQIRQAVLISVADWERIVEELAELEDIRAVDEALAGAEEAVDFEQAVREIEAGGRE